MITFRLQCDSAQIFVVVVTVREILKDFFIYFIVAGLEHVIRSILSKML